MKNMVLIKAGLILSLTFGCHFVHADAADWAPFQASGENAIENKNYEDAEKLFLRALSIAKEDLKKTKSHAKTLFFMGKIKMLKKEPFKAIGYFEKSLKLYSRRFGKTHEKTLAVMEGLAESRIESGKPHYAEPLFRKIIAVRSKELGEKHPQVIATMGRLANLMLILDKPKKALPLFEKVTQTGKETKMDPTKLAKFYEGYGRALRQAGKTAKAEQAETNAMQLRANTSGKNEFVVVGGKPKAAGVTNAAAPVVKTEYKEPEGLKLFRKSLVNEKRYGVSEEYMHTLCKDSRTAKGVAHCIVYWFKAPNKTKDNVYPRLTVRLYEFTDAATATAAQENLRKAANPDTGLNYEWNNITVHGKWMYWLSAGCSYSSTRWRELVSSFKAKMKAAEESALICQCGGACSG